MTNHPNATLAGGTGGLTTLILYLASLEGWKVDAVLASGIATVAATVALFIGRRGLRGLLSLVWRGNQP